MRAAPPTVSVLLPAYNADPWIGAAVTSVLDQSLADFELIVVDDGSTDHTADLVEAMDDPRVRVVRRPNGGIVAALNVALGLARGEYLARHDADDLMTPDRLRRQVEHLDRHRDVVVCGTDYELFGTGAGVVRMPRTPAACRARLAFGTPVAHPTAMLRASVLREHGIAYRAGTELAEDYQLFSELSEHGAVVNLPFVGVRYRLHASQSSWANDRSQRAVRVRIAQDNLRRRGVGPIHADALAAMLFPSGTGPAAAAAYAVNGAPRLTAVATRADGWAGTRTALRHVREQLNGALRAPVNPRNPKPDPRLPK